MSKYRRSVVERRGSKTKAFSRLSNSGLRSEFPEMVSRQVLDLILMCIRSIPNIIASSTAGTFADTPLIPRGVPGSDLGHLLHARSLNSTPSSGSSAAGSSWLGLKSTSNIDAPPSSTFNGVPGFDLADIDGAPRSGQTLSTHDEFFVNETFANLPDTSRVDMPGMEGNAFLWDLINGTAGKDDVDFDAFLQDFGDG
jgi:hypothetical protein